jgi:uroporphyrin-III C-methyltransferase/precorrin-2 dehydrogenase/sirohydrochlorin ferrochelatase
MKLKRRKVVLAGDGDGLLWKAELIAAAGADLLILSPGTPELFAPLVGARAQVEPRGWQPNDLDGAIFAVAECESEEEATAFVAAARQAGAVVNVIDKPAFCDVQFGAIVNRSPLVVSISTDGAAPVFGQAIRAKIEAMLPTGLQGWAQAARDWRDDPKRLDLPFRARRALWEGFTARALAAPHVAPDEADRRAFLSHSASPAPSGRVSLVGAGPGDPELLTLKAVRVLQSADVILHDDLVSAQVLDFARREAKRMLVGKTGHGPSCTQSDINALMISLARQGRHVVRLKSGDPGIFGRAGEEIAACHAVGIPVEIVPGISAAQAAGASLCVSLTHRDHAQRLQFVTGHDRAGALPGTIDWRALADEAATTAVYMPGRTIAGWTGEALKAGLSPDIPACLVARVSRPDERIVTATLGELAQAYDKARLDGPVIALLGRALGEAIRQPQEGLAQAV